MNRQAGLYNGNRFALKVIMASAEDDAEEAPRRLPAVAVVEITAVDNKDFAVAQLSSRKHSDRDDWILIAKDPSGSRFRIGDRLLARLSQNGKRQYRGSVIRRLARSGNQIVGQLERAKSGFRLLPTDNRSTDRILIDPANAGGGTHGDVVAVELFGHRNVTTRKAQVVEILGRCDSATTFSLLAIRDHDIPDSFSAAALAEAESADRILSMNGRDDLRDIPLITIDDADARDFDDAVWAEPDHKGGWRLLVAIADVAHYVQTGAALDVEACKRGNSVYFVDRVVSMLPETLSNDLCSLRPGEDRACLAVEMHIDKTGRKTRHRFLRGIMRSAARTTYQDIQDAIDGTTGSAQDLAALAHPLYEAYRALRAARNARGALEIDVPEMRARLTDDGRIRDIVPRVRLTSHQLIEEFMVLANVAAAESLEHHRHPCVYRVHDAPDDQKVAALRRDLAGFGINVASGQSVRPALFNQILKRTENDETRHLISQLVLRTQSQALYSPENIGHFGLGLRRYAHFTSPIRRYADLLVHRALIAAHGLGDDGPRSRPDDLAGICREISAAERRTVDAERAVLSRCAASVMIGRVGEDFDGVISGVTRFGLFVSLPDGAPDALLPVGDLLPKDFYLYDRDRNTLVGEVSGRCFSAGEPIAVSLRNVDPVAGRLTVGMAGDRRPTRTTGRPKGKSHSRYLRRR